MLSPQLGRAAFRIAFFIAFVSAGLMFFVEPKSAEFVVTSITLGIGALVCVLIIVIVRRQAR